MKTRTAALAAMTAAIVASLPTTAMASNERMSLTCDTGSLAGHTLERTNGASWWDVADGTVYTTTSLVITSGGDTVHHHDYGGKATEAETCTGDHFGFTWHVAVVASAPR